MRRGGVTIAGEEPLSDVTFELTHKDNNVTAVGRVFTS